MQMKIRDIPSGLLTCSIEGEEYGIVELGEHGLTLRMSSCIRGSVITISFSYYIFEKAEYEQLEIENADVISDTVYNFEHRVKIRIENSSYEKMLQFVVRQYQRYIRLKCESYDNSFSEELAGYPAQLDDIYEKDYETWRRNRMQRHIDSDFFAKIDVWNVTFAFVLNMPHLYQAYLDGIIKKDLPEPFATKASRIYIGNEYCHLLFPDRKVLWPLLERIDCQGLEITLMFPVLQESLISYWETYIDEIYDWCIQKKKKVEVVINDFGYLALFQGKDEAFCLNFGTLLNKRRKDPRYVYKVGYDIQKSELRNNSLNNKEWITFLKEQGIERFEYETCGYEMQIATQGVSLHIPLYQTNTSQFCTTYALKIEKDRGKQKFITRCPHFCEQTVMMYPEHLSLVGRMNCIFAWDSWLNENVCVLEKYIQQGVDRLVWNMI